MTTICKSKGPLVTKVSVNRPTRRCHCHLRTPLDPMHGCRHAHPAAVALSPLRRPSGTCRDRRSLGLQTRKSISQARDTSIAGLRSLYHARITFPPKQVVAPGSISVFGRSFSSTSSAMRATSIDGTSIAKGIREKLRHEVQQAQQTNPRFKPSLAIIQGETNCT